MSALPLIVPRRPPPVAPLTRVTPRSGFESLRDAFKKSFDEGTNLGAGLVVYYKNKKAGSTQGRHFGPES